LIAERNSLFVLPKGCPVIDLSIRGYGMVVYFFWGALWNTREDIVLGRNPYFKRAEFHTPLFSLSRTLLNYHRNEP
jgi:hypothetical protein